MKIVQVHTLISRGNLALSNEWKTIRDQVDAAIQAVVWPPGSDRFTIFPESGKKRYLGNGVKPIKDAALSYLVSQGWIPERKYAAALGAAEPDDIATRVRPGNIDAAFLTEAGVVALEWETGNISSSHRSLNKLCLGLMRHEIFGGLLVIPSRNLAQYLTDRTGNIRELEPYFDLWSAVPCTQGVLQIIVVEHDAESLDVPKIPKMTSGRSLG